MTHRAARGAASRKGQRPRRGLLAEAIDRHRSGELADAEAAYRNLLDANPKDADALHFLGVLRHQQGRTDEGIALVAQALSLAPAYVDAWCNLGNLYKESDRFEEAEGAYRRALAISRQHAASWNNLGIVLRAKGRSADAVQALCRAIELAPQDADAYCNLGSTLRTARFPAEAIAAYRHALELAPNHARANHLLGHTLYATGARAEAAGVFSRWLALDPKHPVPAHMLAACSGENIPERASDDYIRATFDGFASSFDEILLHKLDYHAPALLAAILAPVLGTPASACDVLDAGCGTGLCGPLLRPYARALVGVDLSAGMLAKARARRVYDRLHEAELTGFLSTNAGAFDLVASADTLCYFGDLASVARSAHRALRPGGWFAFTTERSTDVATYGIQANGRYHHARAYLEEVLADAGFADVHLQAAVLRRELGTDVDGWVVRAKA